MPTYDYQHVTCNHTWTEILKVDERLQPCNAPCPHCGESGDIALVISSPFIGDAVRQGITKVPSDFKEVINNIKKKHPLNTIRS